MEEHLSFHQRLKKERGRRGWSQEDIASKIGTDPKTVGRWESGRSQPRHYHRQALSTLFGIPVEELGLWSESEKNPLKEDLFEAPNVENFYGRNKEQALLERWIVDDQCRVVAILGMGGIGKTILTAKVVEKTKHTFEYIFWHSLRERTGIANIEGVVSARVERSLQRLQI